MTVKNLKILSGTLTPEQVGRLEVGANLHKRYANIEFKILAYAGHSISIEVKQGKHLAKDYAGIDILEERTLQLFQTVLPKGTEITVHALPYNGHAVSNIDAGWLDKQMADNHITIKDIVADTGLDKTNISAWRNDKRPMPQIVKTMFYYYFLNRNSNTATAHIATKNTALKQAS